MDLHCKERITEGDSLLDLMHSRRRSTSHKDLVLVSCSDLRRSCVSIFHHLGAQNNLPNVVRAAAKSGEKPRHLQMISIPAAERKKQNGLG